MTDKLHPETKIGIVSLKVTDLARALDFYTSALGFQILSMSDGTAHLGVADTELVELNELDNHQSAGRTTGLYHVAILVPSRQELAWSLNQLIKTQTSISGFADHLVSEAIYLDDPDGNGIEIYRDRPQSEWLYEDGQLQMGTLPLNVDTILDEIDKNHSIWPGLSPATRLGHVHLRVSNIDDSVTFYTQALGFDLITLYGPSAGFVSAGGYHHHIGFNTWESTAAPPPHKDSPGLKWFTVDLPDQAALEELIARISRMGIEVTKSLNGFVVHDPSGNQAVIRVVTSSSAP